MIPIIRPGLTSHNYEISDSDQNDSSYFYYGYLTPDNIWVIQRQDNTVTNVSAYRYATVKNNPTYNKYTDAWSARASLTYDYLNLVNL